MKNALDIREIQDGAAIELLNAAIQKCVDDVADVNKDAEAPRSATLKITFAPDESGRAGALKIDVSTSMGKFKSKKSTVWFGFEDGRGVASEHYNVSQPTLIAGETN